MSADKAFLMNLKHLTGNTNAVTPDYILSAIMFINQHSIEECQFIVEEYTRVIFSDDEFLDKADIPICSVDILVSRYSSAIKHPKENELFLKALRSVHRHARGYLEDPQMKARILRVIEERKQTVVFQQYLNVVATITGYVRDVDGLDRRVMSCLTEVIPQFVQQIPLIEPRLVPRNDETNEG